jgi:hypothetical protein
MGGKRRYEEKRRSIVFGERVQPISSEILEKFRRVAFGVRPL